MYDGHFFFTVSEVSHITKMSSFRVIEKINKKLLFAVKIGKEWKIYLNMKIERGIPLAGLTIPKHLHIKEIMAYLRVSENLIRSLFFLKGQYMITDKEFANILFKYSNIFSDSYLLEPEPFNKMDLAMSFT